jgi:membrane protease subunit HflK
VFDRLLEFLLSIVGSLLPWAVIYDYGQGVVLRFGKFNRVLAPGFHWRIPLVEAVMMEITVPRTASLDSLATTTKDGEQIAFHAIVTYKVRDIRKYLLDTHDGDDAVRDSCSGQMGVILAEHTWDEIVHGAVNDPMAAACRKRGFAWGIEVMSVQLAGVAKVRNVRLIHAGTRDHRTQARDLGAM